MIATVATATKWQRYPFGLLSANSESVAKAGLRVRPRRAVDVHPMSLPIAMALTIKSCSLAAAKRFSARRRGLLADTAAA